MPETGNLDASLVLRQLPCRGADFLTSQCSHAVQHMLLGKAASDMILNKSNIKKQNKTKQNKTKQNKTKHIKKRKEKKRKENKRKEKKRKEKKRKEKKKRLNPFRINLMTGLPRLVSKKHLCIMHA